MSLFGIFSNPIEFDKRYNMKRLTTKLVQNSDFTDIENEFNKTKVEINNLVNLDTCIVYANIDEKKVRALYLFQKEDKKMLRQKEAFYISKLSKNEKQECFRSMAHHAVNLIAKAKYYKIILNDNDILPGDAIMEAEAKNPNLKLLLEKAKYFFLAFILATIIDDLISGLVWGIFCSLALGGVKVAISGSELPNSEEEPGEDKPEDIL